MTTPLDQSSTDNSDHEEISFQNLNISFGKKDRSKLTPTQRLGELPGIFTELDLMPIRCTCGRVFKQILLEEGLKAGNKLAKVMDDLGYERICCRSKIIGSPAIVKLQKQIEKDLIDGDSKLNVNMTGTKSIFQNGPEIMIIEEGPETTQQVETCFIDTNEDSNSIGDAYSLEGDII